MFPRQRAAAALFTLSDFTQLAAPTRRCSHLAESTLKQFVPVNEAEKKTSFRLYKSNIQDPLSLRETLKIDGEKMSLNFE